MREQVTRALGRAPWPTVLGVVVSVATIGFGLAFGLPGIVGSISIGTFALIVSGAIISAQRHRAAAGRSVQPPH